jgi:hypothetical protein
MASQTTTTTDHEEIRRWVEEHGGQAGGEDSTFARLVRRDG